MAHARLVLALFLCACGSAPKPAPHPIPPPAEPPAFSAGARMARFHSTRFGVSLPLPVGGSAAGRTPQTRDDRHHWRIDDHSAPVLRATHAATDSLVELAVWREEELVNRSKCEARAHEKRWAPDAAGDEISTEVVSFPSGWDTGVWIGADHDTKTVTGELVAYGAYVHKCLYFRFTTKAPLADAAVISDRLAFARLRIFGGLELDTFDVPRQRLGP